MAAEILPEVKQKEQEEAAKKEEERMKLAKQLAEGKIPKLDEILDDSDEEPEPDAVIEIPLKKVKLVVGPGGEKIKLIEKKSKARLQIVKEEDELNRAFGSGPVKPVLPKPADTEEGPKMTKVMIFGNANQCEIAQRMIEEAIDNKEQKAKQRQKEYEKKRDAKARDRQLYHMRHTRDYETLELPIGASRVEVKAAYRKLAKLWHPDKHPDNQEEAKERFQKISKAYDSLMLTEEDARIEALAN
ncbi:DnaJ-domain-containing protein [Coccomyxa subellipsoidea C-169]|uniref:DnaJ-domain-containing protein n=1 Tax=Coccomyxa subellipsoidea (strain C-169) TaxID=574566 RepID=I0YR70_COCSC|nr:DnaJ-domain-containing protein [Coccomyxa subellipsoidea C-169]EIE20889.1 DnaJ-domain-containing protein [Coccomyxa subellipsoidea C-169]|eukprot:XP_005645433.1 DnaJ-domain-containing protein [Coccomyxa subellipsoidea C-169]